LKSESKKKLREKENISTTKRTDKQIERCGCGCGENTKGKEIEKWKVFIVTGL